MNTSEPRGDTNNGLFNKLALFFLCFVWFGSSGKKFNLFVNSSDSSKTPKPNKCLVNFLSRAIGRINKIKKDLTHLMQRH